MAADAPGVGDLSCLKHCHLATEVENAETGVLKSSCCSWTHAMCSLLPFMASLVFLKYLKQQPVKAEQLVKTEECSWQQKLLLQEPGMVLVMLCVGLLLPDRLEGLSCEHESISTPCAVLWYPKARSHSSTKAKAEGFARAHEDLPRQAGDLCSQTKCSCLHNW